MADEGDAAATRGRARRRAMPAALALAATLGTCATLVFPPRPLLVWNGSGSSPIGLYRLSGGDPSRGDRVVAWPPPAAHRLARQRHYLPGHVPLVKSVAASAGDRVCARGPDLRINGQRVATRRRADPLGRPLPWWRGCRLLRPGELLLLGASRDSFDGRYFGITARAQLVGVARLVWPA